MNFSRYTNKHIWHHTQELCFGISEISPDSVKYTNEELSKIKPINSSAKAAIKVINADTLSVAEDLDESNVGKILCLNMANHKTPGGGVENGATAQEEDLFRKTSLHCTLTEEFYPLKDYEIMYSPDVFVLKNSEHEEYEEPWTVSFVSCAALRNPRLVDGISLNEEDEKITRDKIESIFQLGIKKGYKAIVLGALGCGAFHNPPFHIAIIFQELLEKYQFSFDHITFAVMSDRKNPNYKIFKSLLTDSESDSDSESEDDSHRNNGMMFRRFYSMMYGHGHGQREREREHSLHQEKEESKGTEDLSDSDESFNWLDDFDTFDMN